MSGQNTIKLDFLDINIEGPKSIHILKPKNIKDVNQNYIILLGDDHSIPFQPKTQGPYMDKFLFGLNKLAKYIRCDFYIEDWNVEKIKSFPQHNERQKKMLIQKTSETDYVFQKYANAKELTESDMKLVKYMKYKKFSDLNILKWSNSSCFFKTDACRYRNLKWHYGDLRQRLDKSSGYDHCNLNYVIELLEPLINYLKNKSITTEIMDELIENIEGLGNNVLLSFTTDIKNIINDRMKFIATILSDNVIQKQFKKMNPKTNKLFSDTNLLDFLNLYETYYDRKYNSTEIYEIYNHIASVILEYKSASQERKEKIVEYLNSIELTSEQIDDFYGVIGIGSVFVLDIYFLMRIFKQDPIVNNKIVVGYFGANHCNFTSNFLVNILKTHTLFYEDNVFDAVPQRSYIQITKSVFLPADMLRAQKRINTTSRKSSFRNSLVTKLRNRSIRSRVSRTKRSTRKTNFSI